MHAESCEASRRRATTCASNRDAGLTKNSHPRVGGPIFLEAPSVSHHCRGAPMHRHPRQWLFPLACALTSLVLTACRPDEPAAPAPSLSAERLNPDAPAARIPARLQHLVVIYLENRSFDNLYGEFAGADGLSNAAATSTQVDATGTAFATLPQVSGSPFPATLPNAPPAVRGVINLRGAVVPVLDLAHLFGLPATAV